MLLAFVVLLRSLALLCCGHRAVALENFALRQQLTVFRRPPTVPCAWQIPTPNAAVGV
jgi:hypothetical protein